MKFYVKALIMVLFIPAVIIGSVTSASAILSLDGSSVYDYGQQSAATTVDKDATWLIGEYQTWRTQYVTTSGAGWTGSIRNKRVMRDQKSCYDTVSEGQAYGMLLAMYFNDMDTFDRMYAYARAHMSSSKGLMHWKVNSSGNNVSEFNITFGTGTHPAAWVSSLALLSPAAYSTECSLGYGTAQDFLLDKQACQYARGFSSATDADMDMAGALVFAWYKWGGNYYRDEAAKLIKNIITYDIGSSGSGSSITYYLKNGSEWGDLYAWNPSYYTPAWWSVFTRFINDAGSAVDTTFATGKFTGRSGYISGCTTIQNAILTQITKIDAANGTTGFFPDWCNTSGVSVSQALCDATHGSDRRYWSDITNNGTGSIFLLNNYVQKLSYNSYYDAVRVPWRLAVDYSWNGYRCITSPYTNISMLTETGNFFMQKYRGGAESNMVDGYNWQNASAWQWQNRDGFNMSRGGQNPSVSFIAMNACASMHRTETLWVNYARDWYWYLMTKREATSPNDPNYTGYHYYGNTLRMLSMLYLSGYFIDFSNQ
jgi:hypothetical protein